MAATSSKSTVFQMGGLSRRGTLLPKPSVLERLEVTDTEAVVALLAQRHTVAQDRRRLIALSDVASNMMTLQPMLPQSLRNINQAKQIEVMSEELDGKRLKVKKLTHLLRLATQEHDELLRVNDTLLALAKRKDDEHQQALRQCRIAGAIDADAHDGLMKLETRKEKLIGFGKAFEAEIAKVIHHPVSQGKQCPEQVTTANKKKCQWSLRIDNSNSAGSVLDESNVVQPTTVVAAPVMEAAADRLMFDLRMTGHEVLRACETLCAEAHDIGVSIMSAQKAANELRSVMTDSAEGRSPMWLFCSCGKTACDAARVELASLEQRFASLNSRSRTASVAPLMSRTTSMIV